ncbi:MAG TPA: CDP-alcohol phosphatidyltransferase family protein [candidate division Zixibacteria bacterium]|nr:CDP-alcohol phosphatidyltransferase family protein [candidate division Zixibacteria bacterium]
MSAVLQEFFAPANLFSLARIPLALLIWWRLAGDDTAAALAAAVTAGVTDALDGWLARRRERRDGQINRFGVALDPVADKIFAIILLVALIDYRDFPLWLAGVIVGRDLLILLAGAALLGKRKLVVPSNLPGKYYFAALAVLLASYLAQFSFGISVFTGSTLLFWIWSTVSYTGVLRAALTGRERHPAPDTRTQHRWRTALTLAVSAMTLYMFFIGERPYQGW